MASALTPLTARPPNDGELAAIIGYKPEERIAETGLRLELSIQVEGLLKGMLTEFVCFCPGYLSQLHKKYGLKQGGKFVDRRQVDILIRKLKAGTWTEATQSKKLLKVMNTFVMQLGNLVSCIKAGLTIIEAELDTIHSSSDDEVVFERNESDQQTQDNYACEVIHKERAKLWHELLQREIVLPTALKDSGLDLMPVEQGPKSLLDVVAALSPLRNNRAHHGREQSSNNTAIRKQFLAFYEIIHDHLLEAVRLDQEEKERYISLFVAAKDIDARLSQTEKKREMAYTKVLYLSGDGRMTVSDAIEEIWEWDARNVYVECMLIGLDAIAINSLIGRTVWVANRMCKVVSRPNDRARHNLGIYFVITIGKPLIPGHSGSPIYTALNPAAPNHMVLIGMLNGKLFPEDYRGSVFCGIGIPNFQSRDSGLDTEELMALPIIA